MLNDLIINLLVLFFIFLLSYQFLEYLKLSKEGFTNKSNSSNKFSEYDTNNPDNALILGQKNAGNIIVLREQVDNLSQVKSTVDDLTQQVSLLNGQVQDLVKQQATFAQEIAGSTPPVVTGST